MIDFINKTLSSFFGNKAERDMKELVPIVSEVKDAEKTIETLSNDELRAKTGDFKTRIADHIRTTLAEIDELNKEIDSNPDMDMNEKEEKYRQIDELRKEENKKIEEIL